jgi:hypothetical protein
MTVRYSAEAGETWRKEYEASAKRDDGVETTTLSGMEVEPLYTS